MKDEKLQKAIEQFLLQRINDCALTETEGLQKAYESFAQNVTELKSILTAEQQKQISSCENSFGLLEGETRNCYYRAGFSDAVVFLLGWRVGTWN